MEKNVFLFMMAFRSSARRLYVLVHFLRAYAYRVKVGLSNDELAQAFSLRGRIFGEKLGWVDCDAHRGDRDAYDANALHFGVYRGGGELIAYCRMLRSDTSFMLEHDFAPMIDKVSLRKGPDTVEISRLTLHERYIATRKSPVLQAVLYRAMYRWAKANGVRYWYFVVERKYFLLLKRLFGCEQVGKTHCFQEGKPAVAAMLDLRKVEKFVWRRSRLLHLYYSGFRKIP